MFSYLLYSNHRAKLKRKKKSLQTKAENALAEKTCDETSETAKNTSITNTETFATTSSTINDATSTAVETNSNTEAFEMERPNKASSTYNHTKSKHICTCGSSSPSAAVSENQGKYPFPWRAVWYPPKQKIFYWNSVTKIGQFTVPEDVQDGKSKTVESSPISGASSLNDQVSKAPSHHVLQIKSSDTAAAEGDAAAKSQSLLTREDSDVDPCDSEESETFN